MNDNEQQKRLSNGAAVCAFCREPAGHTLGECPASLDREQAVASYLDARKLLRRCLPIVAADAQMMADITRHAPLDPASQAAHDSTEYESEKLMREIHAMLSPNVKDQRRPEEDSK
jgi:hypothetical protein